MKIGLVTGALIYLAVHFPWLRIAIPVTLMIGLITWL